MLKYNVYLDAALLAVIGYHLAIAPYTKVEESFNIQAIHDILNYGVYPPEAIAANYDHVQFPGVVPRTFEGSLILAGAAKYINWFTKIVGHDLYSERTQANLAGLVRGVLGLLNGYGLIRLRNSVNKINVRGKGQTKGLIGFWYMLLLLTQFHLLYYSSRTLPNFVALPGVLLGLSKILEGDFSGLTWLAFIGIIFRLEIGVFAVIIAFVSAFLYGQSNIIINVIILAVGSILGGASSFAIDSYFWNKTLLPELSSFLFNIVEGKSAEWGVEPWSAYFNHYLWQLFRPPVILLLVLPGLVQDPASDETREKKFTKDGKLVESPAKDSLRILFVSSLLYIAAMSFQPHKEWRFIVYVIPVFTLQAANGLAGISDKWPISWSSRILTIIVVITMIVSAILSLMVGYISSYNYPGGEALEFVNSYIDSNYADTNVTVHMDAASCMSGVNRFGQIHDEYVTYDKTESPFALSEVWNKVSISIRASPIVELSSEVSNSTLNLTEDKNWELIHTAPIFKTLQVYHFISLVRSLSEPEELTKFALAVFREAKDGKAGILSSILRSLVATEDYLYVFKRVVEDQ